MQNLPPTTIQADNENIASALVGCLLRQYAQVNWPVQPTEPMASMDTCASAGHPRFEVVLLHVLVAIRPLLQQCLFNRSEQRAFVGRLGEKIDRAPLIALTVDRISPRAQWSFRSR
jgi:hypothetical protein